MHRMLRISLVLAALMACSFAPPGHAEKMSGWLELSASVYDPDWEFREREQGLRLAAQVGFGDWFLAGGYNTIATSAVDLPVVRVRGLPFRNWHELVVGYQHPLSATTSVTVAAAYTGLELFDEVHSGYWSGATVTQRVGSRVEASLRVAYMELDEQDWRLTGQLLIDTSERTALVLRLDDFAEYDFTWYEIGVRWRFN